MRLKMTEFAISSKRQEKTYFHDALHIMKMIRM